ncbi:hypothetical protein HID58_043932 [Brassica napus]|uniref:Fumarylacetoacetase-like C-terminal domain-containing protein n=4 Tax=Brassica TaxID=3705 RepID=A0ABQ8BHY1_BRANA|nr:hypothetical protein HID58_043932 [Brassica napus]
MATSMIQRMFKQGTKIVGVGLNYASHAKELGNALPKDPIVFLKPTSSYLENGGTIEIPHPLDSLHHEVELAVVIGHKARDVPERLAMDYIGGYALALDMTAKEHHVSAMASGLPCTLAKAQDTFTPISSVLPKAMVVDPNNLELWLKVDDEIRQKGWTKDMIYKVPYLISYISSVMTLFKGDVILTGTPEGIGPVKIGQKITAGITGLSEVQFDVGRRVKPLLKCYSISSGSASITKRFLLYKHRLHIPNPVTPPSSRLCGSRAFSNHRDTLRSDLHNLHLNEALDLFARMSHSRPLPSLGDFTRLLTAIAAMEDEEERYDVVVSLFDQMRRIGVSPLLYTCNIVINSLCQSSRTYYTAFAFLGKMLKLGFEPDVFTFTSLLGGLCNRNRVDDAVALFVKMVEIGCRPNVVTYTSLIHCLCKNRHVDHAVELFNQMERDGVRANVVTYNSLVKCLCDCGRWGHAALLLRDMMKRRIGPNVITFSALIDAFVKAGKVLDAVELYDLMKEMSIEPNVFTYNSLINGFCKHRRLEEAMRMLYWMERKGCVPDIVTYTTLIHGFCKSKRVDDGVRLFNEMSLKGLAANTVTYTVFIQGYCLVGKPVVAQDVFNQMGFSHNAPPDIRTYNVLLDGLCCNGKVEKALMIFEYMRKRDMDVSIVTYTIVIQGMCKVGKVEDAFDLFCSLFSKGMKPNVVTYTTMITGFCRRGLIHEADALFRKMKQDGFLPNERFRERTHRCSLDLPYLDSYMSSVMIHVAARIMNSNEHNPKDQWPGENISDSPIYDTNGKIKLVTIVTLSTIAIIMALSYLYDRWYLPRSRSHHIRRRSRNMFFFATDPSPASVTASRGLDPAVVKSLTVFAFSDATHKDPIDCAVCLSEFEEGESVSGSSAMPLDNLGREPVAIETPRRSLFEDDLTRKGRIAPSSFAGAPSQSPSSSCQIVMTESDIELGEKKR